MCEVLQGQLSLFDIELKEDTTEITEDMSVSTKQRLVTAEFKKLGFVEQGSNLQNVKTIDGIVHKWVVNHMIDNEIYAVVVSTYVYKQNAQEEKKTTNNFKEKFESARKLLGQESEIRSKSRGNWFRLCRTSEQINRAIKEFKEILI